MNFKLKLSYLLVFFIILANTLFAQEILIDSKLQKDTITLGEQVELKIQAKTPKNVQALFPDFKDTLKKNVEIIYNFDVQTTENENYNLYNKRLFITSFDTGNYVIPPIYVGLIKEHDTIFSFTDELNLYVKPYILLDTIPIDTIYASVNGFVVRGHDGFKKEIEKAIPDSIKRKFTTDTLEMAKQYVKEQYFQLFSSKVTQSTTMYDQDQIQKIAEAPEHSLFLVDKSGILSEYVVPGSMDTIFVHEYDQVQAGQPLYTVFRIKDINEDLYDTPFNMAEFLYVLKKFFTKYWWIIIIALLLAAGLIYYFLFYKKDKKPAIFRAKPKEPAHLTALRELEKIRKEKIWAKGLIKEFHVQVTDVIRNYIEDRFGINAKEMTTTEILSSFSGTDYLDNENIQKLKQMLELADTVKFAKYQPLQNENDLSLNNAVGIVESTKEEIVDDQTLKHVEAELEVSENIKSDMEKNEKRDE
ncbi:MAG: hypothetical protein LBQ22_10855 [Bacteroidales bacterium]|jgi:hypothetical protein|nr:hypothetical protein [Bacteroidales bacterium]